MEDRVLYAIVIVVAACGFIINFAVSWMVSAVLFPIFRQLPLPEKGDWCSRANSTLHAFIIIPGFIATLSATEWDHHLFPETNPKAVRVIMCISLGYFAVDFFVMFIYRVPMWIVFVLHHIWASTPYYFHLFYPCTPGTFILGFFMLVELATLILNFQVWLDKLGYAQTTTFSVLFYLNFATWVLTRLGIPAFCLYVMWAWNVTSSSVPKSDKLCLIPAVICAHLITLFCVVVFFGFIVPDFLRRLRESPDEVDKRMQEIESRRRKLSGVSQPPAAVEQPPAADGRTEQARPVTIDQVVAVITEDNPVTQRPPGFTKEDIAVGLTRDDSSALYTSASIR